MSNDDLKKMMDLAVDYQKQHDFVKARAIYMQVLKKAEELKLKAFITIVNFNLKKLDETEEAEKRLSMKEYYTEKIQKYFPRIESFLKDEKVIYRFYGKYKTKSAWEKAELNGLWVVTDRNLYFQGKASFSGWQTKKGGQVLTIPINSITTMEPKGKVKWALKFSIEKMLFPTTSKKVGKDEKLTIVMAQGIENKTKEPKAEWIKRAEEFNSYLKSKMQH